MKAIETIYNGYRFRSRLEARWAVFFDALGVKYEYEKEGYDLDGMWYLPDFWLPKQDCFVEIKSAGQPSAQELLLCSALATHSAKRVFMFSGEPDPKVQRAESSARAFLTRETYYPGKPDIPPGVEEVQDLRFVMQNYAWGVCPWCKKPNIWKRLDVEGHIAIMVEDECKNNSVTLIQDDSRSLGLIAAYTAARQARFEQGR